MAKATQVKSVIKSCCVNNSALLVAGAFVLGCLVSALISSCCRSPKIAVVDVAQIVSQSSSIAQVQEKQQQRMLELQEWLGTVQTEISKEKNKQKQAELTQKYEEELQQKKIEIQNAYNSDIKLIDEKMTHIIAKKAKKKGYKVVLTKSSVITGAKDLTTSILKVIK